MNIYSTKVKKFFDKFLVELKIPKNHRDLLIKSLISAKFYFQKHSFELQGF